MKLEILKPRSYTRKGQATIKINKGSAYISSSALKFLDLEDEEAELMMAIDRKSGTRYVGKASGGLAHAGVKVNPAKNGGATIAATAYTTQGVDPGKYYIEKRGVKEGDVTWFPLSVIDEDNDE